MRKILYSALALVLLTTAGCRDYLDFSNEDEIGVKAKGTQPDTTVVFDNRGADNYLPVKIYSNVNRAEGDYITEVAKNSQSAPQKWEPAPDGYSFYISYDLYFKDNYLSQKSVRIVYPLDAPIVTRIDAVKSNPVLIPSLSSKIGGNENPLTQDKYLVIKATGASFRLQKGTSSVPPIDATVPLVNIGETAVYKLSQNEDIASYTIGGNVRFPTDTPVQSGNICFFEFNGSAIRYIAKKAITINNLDRNSIP
jgi:hypothetical protein